MPNTTIDNVLRQAMKALRTEVADVREQHVVDELLARVKELRAALEDGRKQRLEADELLARMRDRLKSALEGNNTASGAAVSARRRRKAR